jgi:hypothetical protein
MSHTVQNQTRHPVALTGGRVRAPGEQAKVNPKDPHDKALEDEGQLLRIQPVQEAATKASKS